ncbi:MAG: hypothetical protein N3J91_04000 [Verrucomicrobiae bacterium]|nr:hypothetical protein [Verrucomicrobiae bacterium]
MSHASSSPPASELHAEACAAQAEFVRRQLPPGGLFAGQSWRLALRPFSLGPALARELETLGRVLLQFYQAANLLYRRSRAGEMPPWIAQWLDAGKPAELLEWQNHPAFRKEVPRVIRPDLLLTEDGFSITELDSVPGGIGLTAWLQQTYAASPLARQQEFQILGGAQGMAQGFATIFPASAPVRILVSEEAATYRPEMEWLAGMLGPERFQVYGAEFAQFQSGDAVYRFFELFDLPNVPCARRVFGLAAGGEITLTPPPKPALEEKSLLALFWNPHLQDYWRRELGEGFQTRLQRHFPYTWMLDPTPLPPQGAYPRLDFSSWEQLKRLSQRQRQLVIKISGFSERAWGARGVYVGHDLSAADWSRAVDEALAAFPHSPHILQVYTVPRRVEAEYYDFGHRRAVTMPARVRLCPYYFVSGEFPQARARLGGVLATLCPADKKIIHGMADAVLSPGAI